MYSHTWRSFKEDTFPPFFSALVLESFLRGDGLLLSATTDAGGFGGF